MTFSISRPNNMETQMASHGYLMDLTKLLILRKRTRVKKYHTPYKRTYQFHHLMLISFSMKRLKTQTCCLLQSGSHRVIGRGGYQKISLTYCPTKE